MRINSHIPLLARDFGIIFPGAVDYTSSQVAIDAQRAVLADAAPTNALQSQLVTFGNAGIPAYLTNFLDPELTRVLTTPPELANIFGEVKKGDWITKSAMFPLVEATGEVSSYGDYNNNGLAGANVNYEPRQSYTFQIFTRWGDEEMEMAGQAKIDWAAEQNISGALCFAKFLNKSYAFGVAGLSNYGLLNDPALSAPLTPTAAWSTATGVQIVGDVQRMFALLNTQLGGNVSMKDKLTLVMAPLTEPYMLTSMQNTYGTANVQEYLKKAFPNMEIKTAVEYATGSGNLVQLIAPMVQGQKAGFCAFTEKMRAHAIVRDTSSTYQKKSAGTWGAIVKIPAAITQLLGV